MTQNGKVVAKNGSVVVKNPHANPRVMTSIPDPGSSHMLWTELGLCATTIEPELQNLGTATPEAWALEPVLHNKRSHSNEKPAHLNEE